MPFCENCGYEVGAADRFCASCGNALPIIPDIQPYTNVTQPFPDDLNLFSSNVWATEWKRFYQSSSTATCGIILTNTKACPPQEKECFLSALKNYAEQRRSQVHYCILDLADQRVKYSLRSSDSTDIRFVIGMLNQIAHFALPDCILIVGDRDAIPSIQWKNMLHHALDPHSDSDVIVDSDLPYVTLNTNSPFLQNKTTFKIAVGRIPCAAASGFPQALQYFKHAAAHCNHQQPTHAMVLCAEEWRALSQLVYKELNADLYACPPYSFLSEPNATHLSNRSHHNLLCFNLHGGSDYYGTVYFPYDYWVSGDGSHAYSPACLPANPDLTYMISTEACYGAKPYIRPQGDQSVLITALQNRCIAYIGSTQIAYGSTDKLMQQYNVMPMAADVLCGTFTSHVHQGEMTGFAFLKALAQTVSTGSFCLIPGEDIKTICSFALYGDPTLSLTGPESTAKSRGMAKQPAQKSVEIAMPDIKYDVEEKLTQVSLQIAQQLDELIKQSFSFFADISPKFYKISGYDGYKAVYANQKDGTQRILSLYLAPNGKIVRAYTTKFPIAKEVQQ